MFYKELFTHLGHFQLLRLTVFATSSRYPGSQESIDEEEYSEAVRLAQDVVHWAEAMIL